MLQRWNSLQWYCQTCEPIVAKGPVNTDLVLHVETEMLVFETKIDDMLTKQDDG